MPKATLESARRLLETGRVTDAIVAFERALSQGPGSADDWYNLAFLRHRVRRFEDALDAYANALARGVADPEQVHVNRAVILAEGLTRMDDAEAALNEALACNPRHVPALLNLGNIDEQRGRREQAHTRYAAVLQIDPENALALARLPDLTASQVEQRALIARIRNILDRQATPWVERADLGFGLGKALDALGEYEAAFSAYEGANLASRQSQQGRFPPYDCAAHERLVDRLIEVFSRPAEHDGDADGAPPLFICGMFRSGSSLIEQILASHPGVRAGGEISALPTIARERVHPQLLEKTPATFDKTPWSALRAQYLDAVACRRRDGAVLTDKRPDNFLHIGLIKRLFPRAKIIHTQRQPLDNCLAVYFLHLNPTMPYALDLPHIGHWYRQYRRLMAHWRSLYGDDIHTVDYDELVVRPQPVIESLLAHCGLPWHQGCLSFHKTESVVSTPSAWQVRQPLYTRSSGRWRNYSDHLGPLRSALGEFGG
jgi:Tfp pilus assembly protein PilF